MGRSQEFVAELTAAMQAVERAERQRNRALQLQVGATAALKTHLVRARELLMIVEALVFEAFDTGAPESAEWTSAKRVKAKPGRAAHAGEDESAPEQHVLPLKLVAVA